MVTISSILFQIYVCKYLRVIVSGHSTSRQRRYALGMHIFVVLDNTVHPAR